MIEARRHSIFKLKIGKRSVADDVAHVAAIKKAIGGRGSVASTGQSRMGRGAGGRWHEDAGRRRLRLG